MYRTKIINSIRKLDPRYLGTKWLTEKTELDSETKQGRYKDSKGLSRYPFAIFGEAALVGATAAIGTMVGIKEIYNLLQLSYNVPWVVPVALSSLVAAVTATAVIMRGRFAEYAWPHGMLRKEKFDEMERYLCQF